MASKPKSARATEELFIPDELLTYIDADGDWLNNWEKAAAISIARAEDNEGRWRSRTWEFTRLCKAQWPTLSAEDMFDLVRWEHTEFNEEDQAHFLTEWNLVRFIPGTDPLTWALSMSMKYPVNPPSNSPYKRLKNYRRLIGLAAWLQVAVGTNPIFLPTRKIATILGLKDNHTVSQMCAFAVKDGLLEIVSQATTRRAGRFRFKLDGYEGPIKKWITKTTQKDSDESDDSDD